MERVIDKIIEIHRLGCEVDAQIQSCGIGDSVGLVWHIYLPTDFVKVVRALGRKVSEIQCVKPYTLTKWVLFHRGVEIFTFIDNKEVPDLDDIAAD